MTSENLPAPGNFVDTALKNLFDSEMRKLLADVGQPLVLHMPPETTQCPNCVYDRRRNRSAGIYTPGGPKPFERGQACPFCKSKGLLFTHRKENFTAILDPTKKTIEEKAQELGFRATENAIRSITVIETFQDIKDARLATIGNESYRLLAGPVKIGLGAEQFVDTIWDKQPIE